MLIIAAAPDVNVSNLIELIGESSCDFTVLSLQEWQQIALQPQGFIYIKVMPEISFKRLRQTKSDCTLEQIYAVTKDLENYFVHKISMPQELHSVPILILNGFVDFETDLSQFYNHLFYIKKFFNEIKEKENKEKGIVIRKKHKGCKC